MDTEQLSKLCEQWQEIMVKIDTEDFFDYALFCDTF